MHTDTKDATLGLYQKFRVERTDGRSAEGQKHHGCEYFVLDLNHDPHAYKALLAYARSCALTQPELCDDLLGKARKIGERIILQRSDEFNSDSFTYDTRPRDSR